MPPKSFNKKISLNMHLNQQRYTKSMFEMAISVTCSQLTLLKSSGLNMHKPKNINKLVTFRMEAGARSVASVSNHVLCHRKRLSAVNDFY